MLSSKAIKFGVVLGLFAGSHPAYVCHTCCCLNYYSPIAGENSGKVDYVVIRQHVDLQITSCPIPLYTYYGTELQSIYTNQGAGHYEQSYLSMNENFLSYDAYFQKVNADPSLKFAINPSIVSKVDFYLTSNTKPLARTK
ncbi:hypothetical protein NA56DRAFT_713179 [Hyaloscypha hepaticicola]|uniref:Secreted protein n=1 Tax=Hyaloscypha hepaticicola TaxID=2082293 RepID=A0A2J6PED7_9HELO|nr:hypothetical protein NA56DRAFT_713179 [Hyaloscypha hepaticicola]